MYNVWPITSRIYINKCEHLSDQVRKKYKPLNFFLMLQISIISILMLDMILCVQFVNYVPVLLCIFNINNVIVMSALDYQVASLMPVERNVV